ncbi:four helix bundle protein [Bacteroidota bacterium]
MKRRTKKFAFDCINLSSQLPKDYLCNHIKGQLIRSSTSVACNYRAVCLSQSKASFISKLSIVLEESDETEYWLECIIEKNLIEKNKAVGLLKEANELSSIFIKSRKTARKNSQGN